MFQLKPLLPHLRPYRHYLVAGVLSIVVTASIGLLSPLVVGRAIDALAEDVSSRTLRNYGAMIIGLALFQGIFLFAQRMILVAMSRHVEYDLGAKFFHHLARLHMGFFHRYATGDLMARATNDLSAVRMVFGPAIMYTVNAAVTALGTFLFLLYIHPRMTLLVLGILPFVAVTTRVFGKRIHTYFEAVQEDFSSLSTRVQENLSGARVIRAYAQEEREERLYNELNQRYVEANRKLIRWNAGFQPLLQCLVGLGFAAVLAYGGRLLISGELTLGEYVTFTLFLGRLIWPMIAIGWVINLTERAAASYGRMREIFDTKPEIFDGEDLATVDDLRGDVSFQDLTFAYENDRDPVLRGINLEVRAGETVAVVGRTGSGKSTLLSLLPRLIEPPSGQILVDGTDVRRLPLATLRQAIAMVPQESFLFSTTIRRNILFGRDDASDEEVREAARLAGLDRDIEGFSEGLETMVGERGITLSGGQKQRLGLARALLRQAPILLLDDCLSAVDTETEERILGHLREVFSGRTVFQVSHRVSAVRGADLILMLDQGEIRERGTHGELLAKGGLYADLHRRQQLEEQLVAV